MKSRFLLSLVLGLSVVACTSTEDEAELSEGQVQGIEASAGANPAAPEGEKAPAEEAKSGEAAAAGDAAEKAAIETGMDSKAEGSAEAAAPEAAAAPAAAPEEVAAPAPAEAAAAQVVYPTTSLLNLRQGPGTRHAVARKARFGEAISLSGEAKGNWLKTTDGLWVSKAFTSASKPEQFNDPIVNAAAPAPSEAAAPVAEAPAPAEEAPAAGTEAPPAAE